MFDVFKPKPKPKPPNPLLAFRVDEATYARFCKAKEQQGVEENSELLRRAIDLYLASLEDS